MPTLALPAGSLIFVTGVNGLIGSHVVDQLLARGYNVRGAVRDVEKSSWVKEYFDSKHKGAKIELVSVPDMTVDGCYDDLLEGAAGFVHIASPLSGDDARTAVPIALNGGLNALKASAKQPSIKRVVFTSSSIAAAVPTPNVKFTIDSTSFNDSALEVAYAHKEGHAGMTVYAALKTETEKGLWKYVQDEKPGFVFNSILPNVNWGKVLVPDKQGDPSTIAWARAAFTGETWEMHRKVITPQWYVGLVDCALIHVAALLYEEVSNERLLAFAEPFHWDQVLGIFRELYPEKSFPADDERDDRRDVSTVKNGRAEEVLGWMNGGKGWTPMKESLKEMTADWD